MERKELKPDERTRLPQEIENVVIEKGKQGTSREDENPRGEKSSPRKSSPKQKESTPQFNPRKKPIYPDNVRRPKNRDTKGIGKQDRKVAVSDNSPKKHPSERRDRKRIQFSGERNQKVAASDHVSSERRSREKNSSGGGRHNPKVSILNQDPNESESKPRDDEKRSQITPALNYHPNEREMLDRQTNQSDDDPKKQTSDESKSLIDSAYRLSIQSEGKNRREISFSDNSPRPPGSSILRDPSKRRDRIVSFSGTLTSLREKSESELDITDRPTDAKNLPSDLSTISEREASSSDTPRLPIEKRGTIPSVVPRLRKQSEQRTDKQRFRRKSSVHPQRTRKSTENLSKKEQPYRARVQKALPKSADSKQDVTSKRLKPRARDGVKEVKLSKRESWFSEVIVAEDAEIPERSSIEVSPDPSNQKFLTFQRRKSDKDWSVELLHETDYDPHEFRVSEYQTSNAEALLLMIKVCLGTGVFTMPEAYKYAGLFYGVVSTFWVITFMSYGISTLVKCQYLLCKRLKIPSINYPDTLVAALTIGPKNLRRYARNSGNFLTFLILMNRFCNCTVYIIFVAKHMKAIIDLHTKQEVALEVYMVVLTVPLSVISSVRGIKSLAPIAMAADVFMLVTIGVILTYMMTSLPDLHEKQGVGTFWDLPIALSTIMFAFDSVTSVIVIERTMKEPKSFSGFFGVFSICIILLSVSFTCVGFFGYWKFGDDVSSLITMNLPPKDSICQVIMVLSALAVWASYSLQIFVPVFYLSRHLKHLTNSFAWEYLLRVCWVIFPLIFAAGVPELKLIIPFFGSLCGPLLQFGFPALIEFCLKYSDTVTYGRWIAVVDVCIIIYALTGIVTGLHSTITIIYLGRFT